MILTILNIINTILIVTLFVDVIERRFPNEFKELLFEFSYNSIYFYSKIQIIVSQTKAKAINFIDSNKYLSKIKNEINQFLSIYKNKIMIELVYSNGEIKEINNSDIHSCNPYDKLLDFYIYNYINNVNCINKRIVYNQNELDRINIEESDIKFILIELKIGQDNIYKIELNNNDYNFYLVGNKFSKSFFRYYLQNILKINKEYLENSKFSVKIIDNDVNIVEFDFTEKNETILLEKNSYKIE